jgi:hypothetical protein
VTYYELRRFGANDAAACAADDVTFRATAGEKRADKSAAYSIREGGFVLAGLPAGIGVGWVVDFKNAGRDSNTAGDARTLSLRPGASAQFSFGSQRFSIAADDCRVMIEKDTGAFLSKHSTSVVISRQ